MIVFKNVSVIKSYFYYFMIKNDKNKLADKIFCVCTESVVFWDTKTNF